MNCQQVQINLSLYLYGELEFSREEELEQHLSECSYCQVVLGREKSWHTKLNATRVDVSLDLLSQCRRDLRGALQSERGSTRVAPRFLDRFYPSRLRARGSDSQAWDAVKFASARWSPRLAFASFFLFLGFSGSRWINGASSLPIPSWGGESQAGLVPSFSRIRTVEGSRNNRIRIVLDQVREQEVVGSIDDPAIRELLLAGMKDPSDPGLRADAVELVNGHNGSDLRDALLFSATHDENAAVRLKALEGLRSFREDQEARDVLLRVLEEDADPAVRSQAIDVLLPTGAAGPLSPDVAIALQSLIQSRPDDDYLRARCLQVLARSHQRLY